MASRRTIGVEAVGGVAVEIIGTALSKINGIPQAAWIAVLVFGVCLLVFASVQWFRSRPKEKPGTPLPVLDLTDSHDISFSGITFEAKGTVLKTDNSYNISMQDVEINQRDEKDGETPITS